jgi:hypothetical protein
MAEIAIIRLFDGPPSTVKESASHILRQTHAALPSQSRYS